MTESTTVVRRRRRGTTRQRIPDGVRSWFTGAARVEAAGWHALLPDERPQLLAWWRDYCAENPKAMPPADAEWIDWRTAA